MGFNKDSCQGIVIPPQIYVGIHLKFSTEVLPGIPLWGTRSSSLARIPPIISFRVILWDSPLDF